jgi:translocation and assembly module TamB
MAVKLGRLLRWTVFALLLLIVIVAGVVVWVVGTPSGTRFAADRALGFVPQAAVGNLSGSVWRGLELQGVRYSHEGLEFEADLLWLELAWPSLMAGELHVRRVGLGDGRLVLPVSETEAEPRGAFDLEAMLPTLPVSIRIDEAEIRRLTVITGPDADPVVIDGVRLGVRADADAFELSTLEITLDAPARVQVAAEARLGLAAPHPLALTVRGDATVEEGRAELVLVSSGPLAELTSSGDLVWTGVELPSANASFEVTHDFESARIAKLVIDTLEGRLSLKGDVAWAEAVSWALQAEARGLQLGELVETIEGPLSFDLVSQGRLEADGSLSHETRLSEASLTAAGVAITDLLLDVAGGLEHAEIAALSASLLGGELSASGSAQWGEGLGWSLSVAGRELDPGVFAEAAAGKLGFTLESEGSLDDTGRLAHTTRLEDLGGDVAGVGFEAVRLRVSGDLERVLIDDFSGLVLGARLSGGGELGLGEPLSWSVLLSLDEADLGLLAEHVQPTPTGWVGFDLASSGELREGRPFGEVTLERLRGELDGQALAGRAQAAIAGEAVRVSPVEISVGANRVLLSGQVTPPFDLAFELDLPELDALPLLPQFGVVLAGAVEGRGEVGGTPSVPRVDATLSARNLKLDETLVLARLDARAELREERIDVTVRVAQLEAGGETVSEADLRASGSMRAHEARLDATTGHGRIGLALDGGLVGDSGWSGRVSALSLVDTVLGSWALESPVALSLAGADFSLGSLCLAESAQQGRLCMNAERSGERPIRAAAEGTLALALAREWLPPELELPGTLRLKADARIGERIDAEARVELPDDVMLFSGLVDESISIEYRNVAVDVTVTGDRMQARLGAELPSYGRLDGEVQAVLAEQGPLSGRVTFDMDDIAWLQAFVPEVTDLAGRARAAVALAGTIEAPLPVGEVRIDGVALTVPLAGVSFVDGSLLASIDESQKVRASARIAGGEQGELRIEGEGSASMPDWNVTLRIDGEGLAMMRTPEIDLDISPALRVQADGQSAIVSGRVVLPLVAVRVYTLPEGSVGESPDLVLAGATEPGAAGYAVRTDLDIVLGERVSLEGMGFSTGLSGELRLRGDETAPIAAFGEVDLRDGRYSAYGQNLAVDQGRLSFNGPLDDPGLDVRASRTVGGYQAGLEIRGTLMNPRSQVFSIPALPESDALSLLLTGRLLSAGTTGADATLLVNALAGLGVSQGDEILRDIGQTVGFDEFGLDAGNGFAGTQLTIGKRLSSRLMVRYAVGVFDGVGRFVTEYRINRFLDLEIVSSPVAQGGDLIYRIER